MKSYLSVPCGIEVNGCLLDPVPPMVIRKGCQSLPTSMMETSIDEGIETEGEAEDDPAQAFAALQAARSGKRRHTLAEVTDQLVVVPGTGMGLTHTHPPPSSMRLLPHRSQTC